MTATVQRWYLDNGKHNEGIDTAALDLRLKALFANWVLSGFHERDFIEAAEHTATGIYSEFLLRGTPDLKDEVVTFTPTTKVPDQRQAGKAKPRFYNEDGHLSVEVSKDSLRKALAGHFVEWVNRGYHARDFIQGVKDLSSCVYYDYDVARSLGGLGGGKGPEEVLDAPFSCNMP